MYHPQPQPAGPQFAYPPRKPLPHPPSASASPHMPYPPQPLQAPPVPPVQSPAVSTTAPLPQAWPRPSPPLRQYSPPKRNASQHSSTSYGTGHRSSASIGQLSRRSSGNSTLAGLAGGSGPEGYVQRMRRAKATVWSERGQKEETVVGTKGSKKKKKEEGRFNTMRARVFHSSSHRPQSVSSPSYYHDPSPYHPTLPPRLSASEAGADTDDGPMRGPSMGPPAPVQRQISSGKRSGLREEISLTPIETAVTAEPSLRSASSVQSPARHSQSLRTSGEDQNYGISRQGSTVQFEEPPRPPSRTGSPTNDIQVYSHQPSRHASFSDIDSDEEGIGGWRVGGGQGRLFIANLAEGELSDSD